jgi:hypothetical protein
MTRSVRNACSYSVRNYYLPYHSFIQEQINRCRLNCYLTVCRVLFYHGTRDDDMYVLKPNYLSNLLKRCEYPEKASVVNDCYLAFLVWKTIFCKEVDDKTDMSKIFEGHKSPSIPVFINVCKYLAYRCAPFVDNLRVIEVKADNTIIEKPTELNAELLRAVHESIDLYPNFLPYCIRYLEASFLFGKMPHPSPDWLANEFFFRFS